MPFTLEQKHQILRWHFVNSIRKIPLLFAKKYNKKCSRVNCERAIKLFEKNGCLHSNCRKCTLNIDAQRKIDEENEESEIFVCAAAELELSQTDIGLELDINPRKVSRILKKHGYTIDYDAVINTNESDEKVWQPNLSWEEKKIIVKWYYSGDNLSEVISSATEHFKHNSQLKYDVYYTIQTFKEYSCIRDCNKCASNIVFKINDKEIEEAIFREINEDADTENENEDIEKDPLDISNEDIKLEMERTNDIHQNFSSEISKIYSPIKRSLDSPPPLVDRYGREYLILEPRMGIIVINDKSTNTMKRLKLS